MNTEQFTNAAQELINQAVTIAMQRNNPTLQPIHLLAAGLEQEFTRSFLQALDVPLEQLHNLVVRDLNALPTVHGSRVAADHILQEVLPQ